jgi:predicted alpha/beta hydrolase family esterase
MTDYVASPAILAALRSTMHVRHWGERWDEFSERVGMSIVEARGWSRQRIADYVRDVEARAKQFESETQPTTSEVTQ